MTVSAQVKQTLASLKGVQATLETFATIEKNREAKSLLAHNSRKLNLVIGELERRLGVLEFEEPQYKGY